LLNGKPGANIAKFRLPARVRPGTYTLTWVARAAGETVSRTLKVSLVTARSANAKPKPNEIELVLSGQTPAGEKLRPGRDGTPRRLVSVAGVDQTFDVVSASGRKLTVVVVDADAYGTRIVADLRTVFPSVRVVAVSGEPATRALALRAGAVRALPRSVSRGRLAKAVAAAASS
jgi:hypothetical protein